MSNKELEKNLDMLEKYSYQIVDIKSCILELSSVEDENKIKSYNYSFENFLLHSKKDNLLNLKTDVTIRNKVVDTPLVKARFEIIFKILSKDIHVKLEDIESYLEDIRLHLWQSNFDTIRGLLYEKLKDTQYKGAIMPFVNVQSMV